MRRIQTWEFKLSILIVIISSFIVPGNITQYGSLIKYSFGFPAECCYIYQANKVSPQLFNTLFNGYKGMNINILGLFANVFIIYALLVLIKKMYLKVNSK